MQQTVHLFVFDTLADWKPGFAVAGINNPESQAQPGRYRIKTVGLTAEPVTTIGGVFKTGDPVCFATLQELTA